MAKTEVTPVASEKTFEVRLLRHYVPRDAKFLIAEDDAYAGTARETKLYVKRQAGEVLTLSRDETKFVVENKIGEIAADLI